MIQFLKAFTISSLFVFLIFAYSHWIEPSWIEVKHLEFYGNIQSPLKIAHLTDLHLPSNLGTRETRTIQILQQEAPDVILITGDSVSDSGNYDDVDRFLKLIRAPLGIWIVNGNWEHWRPNRPLNSPYKIDGVYVLNNENAHLRGNIWIAGLDDNSSGSPDLNKSQENIPKDAFTIGLFHSPDYFQKYPSSFNLVLAGHTHGGQIRIPFFPPLWLPRGSGPFVEGWYSADHSPSKMYVSRGIGTSIFDIRLFCRPELPVIMILPQGQPGSR